MFNRENALNEIDFLSRKDAKISLWNDLHLVVPPTVYPPREDTDLLSQVLKEIHPFGSKRLLEIGSGSGALSITAAMTGWAVDACDINPYAVAATHQNAQTANVSIRVSEGGIGPIEIQPMKPAWDSGAYDVVLWNMPYIPAEEAGNHVLGPMEEAALIDTHPDGLLEVFARNMAKNKLCKMDGMAFVVCRRFIDWKRSVDIFRRHGIASRLLRSVEFDDQEAIHVIAAWHPFISGKHHKVREIDSTNAEMLRGNYSDGDSLVATIQTDGRGRHGNHWQDHPDSFKGSWLLDSEHLLDITPLKQLYVTQEIRSALCFEKEHLQNMLTKWPNDLLLRGQQELQWHKVGGVLFQSFSKGDQQRIVIGIGINTNNRELQPGQGSLDEIGIYLNPSELFTILNAVVASIFEKKHMLLDRVSEENIDMESVLSNCIYRNQSCTVKTIIEQKIIIEGQEGQTFEIDDDDQINWKNLHPQ